MPAKSVTRPAKPVRKTVLRPDAGTSANTARGAAAARSARTAKAARNGNAARNGTAAPRGKAARNGKPAVMALPAEVAQGLGKALGNLRSTQDTHVAELQEFVRIPSVSADSKFSPDVQRAAQWLLGRLERAGLENVALVPTSGHPSVVADWLHAPPAPDGTPAPTLLVYGHYDVQPAAKADGWKVEPFEARIDGGRILGRGTTDDKGQLLCHVLAAEAWLKTHGSLPVNLKFVFEGEEEVGSLHFNEVLDRAGSRLQADLLIVSDSPMRDEDWPAITYSLRGLTYLLVDVDGPDRDLHSGTFGGIVWNPNEALVQMLATIKDPKTGKVRVKGFYDGVVKPTAAQRAALKKVSESDKALLAGTGSPAPFGEAGWTAAERIGIRPTLEINGLRGGYTGEGAKTVIPKTAHAKVSCRLVANQDPVRIAKLVEAHLKKVAPKGVKVRVEVASAGSPVYGDPDHPLVAAVAKALQDAFGKAPAFIPEGGSIPAVADMQKRLGTVPILAGFGHRDENMHAPEESFRLKNFFRGREAAARMLANLAASR